MQPIKTIYVRPTRLTERFTKTDLFIAWFDGEPAGTMAETELKAIEKLFFLTQDPLQNK